ncbi:MAG TPA: 6-pyruvoyl-tetrahydropterin synthase-related protein [Thermoanaerobaculia bacterium]
MKQHRFALILLPILATIPFLGPLLRREIFVLRDHFDYFAPLRWFTAEQLKQGVLPFWNPYSASGEPWLANPQTGVFYPPAWLFLALPFETAYVLFLLVHVIVLGLGAYLLFSRGRSQGAGLVGAVALMFAGPTLSLMDVSNNLTTFAWIPLVLWCALERKPIRAAFALAMAFLAGEPLFAAIAALMYVVVFWRSASTTPPSHSSHRSYSSHWVSQVAITAVTAFGLTAVQLLPFLQMIRGSDRDSGLDRAAIFRDSTPFSGWLGLFLGGQSQHFIAIVYVGIVVCVLALAGATRWRESRPWLALLALSMIASAGIHFPPAAWLIERMPVTLFRYPGRFIPFGAFAVVALAVIGWERIRRPKRWLDLIVVALILVDVLPATRPLFVSAPFSTKAVPYDAHVGADAKIVRVGKQSSLHPRQWLSGYLNLYERRYDESTAAPLTSARVYRMSEQLATAPHPDLLAFLPAGWVLTDDVLPAPFVKEGAMLYRWPHPLPLATFWSSWQPSHDGFEEFLAGRAGGKLFVNLKEVPRASHAIHPASLTMGINDARVVVEAPSDGILVLAQQDAAGWRVSVDGRPAEKLLANGIFRAVHIEKGRHTVVWTYRAPAFFIGGVMTLFTLSTLSFFIFVKRRKERKFLLLSHEMRGVESPLSNNAHL